ncbi:3613_t:CDS:2, partial [Dentiscutata heterogama]
APLENPRTVIETLLVSYSRFTLASTLPDEFTANQFDYYLEQLTASSSQPSIPPQTSEETTTTFGSPILGEYQKPFEQFTFNSPTEEFASSQLYPSLEQIENREATSTSTLTPYREETTPIQFSQRTEHPSSPALPFYQTRPSTLTETPLGPPEPQQPIPPSTELSESSGLISKFIRHFTTTTPVTPKEDIISPIPGQFPTTTTSSSNIYPQIPSPQTNLQSLTRTNSPSGFDTYLDIDSISNLLETEQTELESQVTVQESSNQASEEDLRDEILEVLDQPSQHNSPLK